MKRMKPKAIFISLSIIIGLALVGWGAWFLYDAYSYTPTDQVFVSNIEVKDNIIVAECGTSYSAKVCKGYSYYKKDKSVYIRLKYNYVLVNDKNLSDRGHIVVNDDFTGTEKVYLQGAPGDLKLVWENGAPVK